MMQTPALSINNLHKTYASGTVAIAGVDLVVHPGDFFALLGPNGAGKTSIIGIITSLVNKTQGTVTIFGKNIDTDLIAAKRLLGLVPQEFNFSIFEKVIDIVVSQAGYYGISRKTALQRAELYLKKLDLWDKRDAISRTLSGGMKRRLMIVRALIHQPKILLLDEPTAGVDIELRRSTWKFLQEINRNGTTIILTTHYLEEAENLCNGIAIIDAGKIVKNTTIKELLKELNYETVVLELQDVILECPDIATYKIIKIDDFTLEICFAKEYGLNDLFAALSALHIKIIGMRNKSNRLEQLFMSLVTTKDNKTEVGCNE